MDYGYWNWVVIILTALITWLITRHYYIKSKSRVNLTAELLYSTNLVDVDASIKKELIIVYRNREIDNIYKTRIALYNNGNSIITKDNIVEPITITLKNALSIIDCKPRSLPEGYKFEYELGTEETGKPNIVLCLDKLAPKEEIIFELSAIGSDIVVFISGITVPPRSRVHFIKYTETKRFKILDNLSIVVFGLTMLGVHYALKFLAFREYLIRFLRMSDTSSEIVVTVIIISTGVINLFLWRFVYERYIARYFTPGRVV
jgi:hypothetical protein